MESEVHSHNSSYIYSVENQMGTIEFFLSTQTWSKFKLSWLKSYKQSNLMHNSVNYQCKKEVEWPNVQQYKLPV